MAALLSINEPLRRSSRLTIRPELRDASLPRDVAVCLLAGVAAALAVGLLDLNLRIPGHAILRSILPVTAGMALAPRRLSGALIGGGALATSALLRWQGVAAVGWGALTSLLLLGPLLDVALWQTRPGRAIFFRCAAAGLMANMAAYAVRGGSKLSGLDALGMRPLSEWWSVALATYALCGLLAGLAGAALCFRWLPRSDRGDSRTVE
jgi:hypothetical protein